MMNDVIAAIATAPGTGAIGIVRLSGVGALDVLRRMFSPGVVFESHRMYYGTIHRGGAVVDEVMVCAMLAPRSYTREDVVEIYGHGGMFVLRDVLDTAVKNGARLAQPGEFTKRAFLNGRLNLSQAEAVMDIIAAQSESARRAGLKQLGGGLSRRIEGLRDRILTWIAHIELSIDYPEHEDEAKNAQEILGEGGDVLADLEALKATAAVGKIIREGVRTAIVGRPNVGKSTLLNAVLSEDRAIVHEMAGTTRDVLTEHVVAGDVHLVLMDTAGIRDTADPIEKIGVEKSLAAADEAELVLFVVDRQEWFADGDDEILRRLSDKRVIVLLNKSDLAGDGDMYESVGFSDVRDFPVVEISAKTGQGLDRLYAMIGGMFLSGGISGTDVEQDILTRERHRALVDTAVQHVKTAMDEIKIGTPEDLVSVNLRAAYVVLGEVLGVEIGDDVVDRIFEEFCLGK